jgi:hypothetical protein
MIQFTASDAEMRQSPEPKSENAESAGEPGLEWTDGI